MIFIILGEKNAATNGQDHIFNLYTYNVLFTAYYYRYVD